MEETKKINQAAIAILKSSTSQYLENYCLNILDQLLILQQEVTEKDRQISNLLEQINKLTKVDNVS